MSTSPVVLFYTDNGVGLGHLTRQAAVASRANGRFRPVFLTMSAAFTLLSDLGLPSEYFPSYGQVGIPREQWEPLMADRLVESIRLTGASVVVVDHVSPPRIIGSLRRRSNGVRFVWVRRGLWQPGKNRGVADLSDNFDVVVEPGDVAAPIDHGGTVSHRSQTRSLSPVVMTDPDQFLPRAEARAALGIPREGRAVLISLGDLDPTEVGKLIARAKSAVISAAADPVHLFAPLHPLGGDRIPKTPGVTMMPVYPVARYFNAFDGAISTAGYNSFHEIVGSGLPAVFVPHRGASIDDQPRRAEFAALCGRAHWAPSVYDESFGEAVARMLRPEETEVARKTTSVLGEMTGAREFAAILGEEAAAASRDIGDRDPFRPRRGRARRHDSDAVRRLTDAIMLDDIALAELADDMDPNRIAEEVVLVRDGDPRPLYDRGVVLESLISESEWAKLSDASYAGYLATRIAGISGRYPVDRRIASPRGLTPQREGQRRSMG